MIATLHATPLAAEELDGPARFCGYSPIIDLADGERITTLGSGIQGGSFRWDGDFGTLEVMGARDARRPVGRIVVDRFGEQPARFAEYFAQRSYIIAIWDGAQGVAYFSSPDPMTQPQIEAIERVRLYDGETAPEGCDLYTVFVWE